MSLAIRDIAREFVELALPVTGPGRQLEAVIYQDQKAADVGQPSTASFPFAAIKILDVLGVGGTVGKTTSNVPGDPPDDDLVKQIRGRMRVGTLNVQLIGEGSIDLAEDLEMAMDRSDISVFLRQNGLAVHPIGPILDTTELLDTINKESAQIDFRLTYRQDKTDLAIPINTATVTLTET